MRLFLRRIVIFVILVAFITIGIWLISDVQVHERYGAILPICIGILTLLFFGLGGLVMLYRDIRSLFTHEQYLQFTDKALVIAGDKVAWNDIQGFQLLKISGSDIIAVVLKSPETVINRCQKPWKRWLMKVNYKYFGMVYSIAVINTNFTKDELFEYCCRELDWHSMT